MKKAIISDWDGTLASCQEKIDLSIMHLLERFDKISNRYVKYVRDREESPGWIKNGVLISLPEDYFTYHFGLIARLISECYGIENDKAWSIILKTFGLNYKKVNSRLLFPKESFKKLLTEWDFFIVSNSQTDNLINEISVLGLNDFPIKVIGGAKKYKVDKLEPKNCYTVSANRPIYQKIITEITSSYEDVIFWGDNFCCDLLLPHSLGYSVYYIPNPLTHPTIQQYIDSNRIILGNTVKIIDILTNKFQRREK